MSGCFYPSRAALMYKHDPEWAAKLSPLERLVLPYHHDFWLRSDQRLPAEFSSCGFLCGRGWGKSSVISWRINDDVRAGIARNIALIGPNEDTTRRVCVKMLINESPPWFKAVEDRGGVLWPNGARAYVFTAETGEIRGDNLDHVWATELAFWPANTRAAAWENVTTAVRTGVARTYWDTTTKGKNEIVKKLLARSLAEPRRHVIMRGSMFDNEWFSSGYLRDELLKYPPGRRRQEEVEGEVFFESSGALWEDEWIDKHRVATPPRNPSLRIVSVDPATTSGPNADACGFIVGELEDGHVYVLRDSSERMQPHVWGDKVVDEYERGATGVVAEVTGNSGGDNVPYVVKTRAEARGLEFREIAEDKPFPPRLPGVLYFKVANARDNKETRAYPAASLTEQGKVHMVGRLDELENELTSWVPGERKSPNRLDACARLITELSGIARERPADFGRAVNDAEAATAALADRLRQPSRQRVVW
jgi:phage terminase large subunit-like protein